MDWIAAFFTDGQLAGNLIAGLLASLLTWGIIALREMIDRWRKCSRFAGRYEVVKSNGDTVDGEIVTVKWIGGFVMEAVSNRAEQHWRSVIMLDPHIPTVGRGYFEYDASGFVGRHDVQMAANQRDIYVFSHNPSSERPSRALIWRRV